jgi:hypothetical protein
MMKRSSSPVLTPLLNKAPTFKASLPLPVSFGSWISLNLHPLELLQQTTSTQLLPFLPQLGLNSPGLLQILGLWSRQDSRLQVSTAGD